MVLVELFWLPGHSTTGHLDRWEWAHRGHSWSSLQSHTKRTGWTSRAHLRAVGWGQGRDDHSSYYTVIFCYHLCSIQCHILLAPSPFHLHPPPSYHQSAQTMWLECWRPGLHYHTHLHRWFHDRKSIQRVLLCIFWLQHHCNALCSIWYHSTFDSKTQSHGC